MRASVVPAIPMWFFNTLDREVQRNTEFKESLFFGETWTVMFSHLKPAKQKFMKRYEV